MIDDTYHIQGTVVLSMSSLPINGQAFGGFVYCLLFWVKSFFRWSPTLAQLVGVDIEGEDGLYIYIGGLDGGEED
jgi:hypothetical protein